MRRTMQGFPAWQQAARGATGCKVVFESSEVLVAAVTLNGTTHKLVFKAVSASRDSAEEQFNNEAKAAFKHRDNPTIVPVLACKKDADGNTLLVSAFGGQSLQDLLDSPDFGSTPMKFRVQFVNQLLAQLVPALQVLAACGEVHADIKAPNILWDGCVLLLLDMGAWSKMLQSSGISTLGENDEPMLGTTDPDTGRQLRHTPGAMARFSQSSLDVMAAGKTMIKVLLGGKFPVALDPNNYADQAGNISTDNQDKLMALWAQVCDAFSAGRPTGVPELDALVAMLQPVQQGPEMLQLLRRMLALNPAARITVTQLAQSPLLAPKVLEQLAALKQDQAAYCQHREELEQLVRQLVPDAADLDIITRQERFVHDITGHLSHLHNSLELRLLKAKVAALQLDHDALLRDADLMQQQQHNLERRNRVLKQHVKALAAKQAGAMAKCEAAEENEQRAVEAAATATAERAAVQAQAAQRKQQLQQHNLELQQQLQKAQAAARAADARRLRETGQLEDHIIQLTQQLQEAKQAAEAATAAAVQAAEQQAVVQAAATQPPPEQLQRMPVQLEAAPVACGKQASVPEDDELQMPPLPPINVARSSSDGGSSFEPDTPERCSSAGVAVVTSGTSSSNDDDSSTSTSTSDMAVARASQQQEQQQVEVVEPASRCRVNRRFLMGLAAASVAGMLCVVSRHRRR